MTKDCHFDSKSPLSQGYAYKVNLHAISVLADYSHIMAVFVRFYYLDLVNLKNNSIFAGYIAN